MSDKKLLKDLARQYVKEQGESFIKENSAIAPDPTHTLDMKMMLNRSEIKEGKTWPKYVTIAASFVVLFVVGTIVIRYNIDQRLGTFVTEVADIPSIAEAEFAVPEEEMVPVVQTTPGFEMAEMTETATDSMYSSPENEWGDRAMAGGGVSQDQPSHAVGVVPPAPEASAPQNSWALRENSDEASYSADSYDPEFMFDEIIAIVEPNTTREQMAELATAINGEIIYWGNDTDRLQVGIGVRAGTVAELSVVSEYLLRSYPDVVIDAWVSSP